MGAIKKLNRKRSVVFKTEWFTIDTIPYGSSGNETYYRLSCSDSVSILAKTVDDKIIMVRQYRPAIEAFTYEFPSGYIDVGESPEKAMKREFQEETGYQCKTITYMGALKIVPSRINNTLYVFFGKDADILKMQKMGDKETQLILATVDEFRKLISDGTYVESSGIAMFQLAQLKGYL